MIKTRTLKLARRPVAAEQLGFFRFGSVAGKNILTNDAGEWTLLSEGDFRAFAAGELPAEHPRRDDLVRMGMLREGSDLDGLAERVRRKKAFVGRGPHLHVVVTTLRCNQTCRYCHASRADPSRTETDMSVETAKQVVDFAMRSTSPYLNFEFQGGEPTYNMDAIRFIVDYARERNRGEGKELDFSLVTNFTQMDEEKANWLVENGLWICTSLDGPAHVHDHNRLWQPHRSAHGEVMRWMRWFNQRYIDEGRDPNMWHVDALMTTTRKTLDHWREVIDLYVELGIRNVHLRPLNPYGFAHRPAVWAQIGYSIEEFLDVYAQALDYILELNRQGVEIQEGTASTFLTKMLTPDDPNYVDIRSPCGAGCGQVAYDHDGQVYPCDEARMVAAVGDHTFSLGPVGSTTPAEALQHPTVRAMAVASLQDSLPACDTCWNKPFCGVCPMHAYQTDGDLFGQRPRSRLCKQYLTTATLILEHLARDESGETEAIFRRWTLRRNREGEA